MALEITYWSKAANRNIPRAAISTETRSLSGTSAQSGATPSGCAYVSLLATEATRFAYGENPTATATAGASGHYIASGERIWIEAVAGNKFAGIQAS
jgi:hypothetical protein